MSSSSTSHPHLGKALALLGAAAVGSGGHAAAEHALRGEERCQCQVSLADPVIVGMRNSLSDLEARVRAGEISSRGVETDISTIKASLLRLESYLLPGGHR